MQLLPRHPVIGYPEGHSSLLSIMGNTQCAFLFVHLTFTAFHVTKDLWDETSESCYLAGVKPSEIAIASIISQYHCLVGEIGTAASLLYLIYMKIGSVASCLAIPACLLQILQGISLGLLISSVCILSRNCLQIPSGCVPPLVLGSASAFFAGL